MTDLQKTITGIIRKLAERNNFLCTQTLQKMVFLIQEKGADLGLKYRLHFYGPYSRGLYLTLQEMNLNNIIYIDRKTNEIILLQDSGQLASEHEKIADKVISEFGLYMPSELDFVTSVLYISKHMKKNNTETIKAVQDLKGSLYSECLIQLFIDKLQELNYLAC